MCYSVEFLHGLLEDGSISHQDGATRFLLNLSDQSFIFGDQIGVDPHTSRRGIGRELMLDMFERMKRSGVAHMYVTILHNPVRNEASIRFCEGLGAQCVQEVTNKDGLTWGIYRFTP